MRTSVAENLQGSSLPGIGPIPAEFHGLFVSLAEAGEVSPENLESFLSDPASFKDRVVLRVDVNHTRSLAQHLSYARLHEIHALVRNGHFPTDPAFGKETAEYRIIQTGFAATTREVREEIEERGLTPANLYDTLAFAARYPGKQYQFEIASLGGPCRKGTHDEYILVLGSRPSPDGRGKIRVLDILNTSCLVWHPDCRFLCRIA